MKRIELTACELNQISDPDQTPEPIQTSDNVDALQQLMLQQGDPARLLECYYWSKEPGLLECIRAFLAAPAEVRSILQAFFAAAVVRERITAAVDSSGNLKLGSPDAARILVRFFANYATDNPSRHCC